MFELYGWKICKWEFAAKNVYFVANGFVFNNPKFRNATEIHTSKIEKISMVEEGLLIRTYNSEYLCKYAEAGEVSEINLQNPFLTESMQMQIKQKLEECDEKMMNDFLSRNPCPGEILFVFSNRYGHYMRAAYGILADGTIVKMFPIINYGESADTVVLTNMGHSEFCYAYFVCMQYFIEFCAYDDETRPVTVLNAGSQVLKMKTPLGSFEIQPGEMKKCC